MGVINDNFVHRTLIISPGVGGQSVLFAAAIGDWSWDVCHKLCGVDPYNAKSKNGQPTYFSFFYYHIWGNEKIHFRFFNIGHEIDVFSFAYSCTEESLHIIHQVRLVEPGKKIIHQTSNEDILTNPDPNCLYIETFNRWVSRISESSNEKLEKASPEGFSYKHLPQIPNEYAPWNIYKKAMQEKIFLNNNFENYDEISNKILSEIDYKIDPNKDINGVGLLYFASYFSIFDFSLMEIWKRLKGEEKTFFSRKVVNQKICYLGNADYQTPLRIIARIFRNKQNPHDYIFNFEMYRLNDYKNIAICTMNILMDSPILEKKYITKSFDLSSFQNDLKNDLASILKKSASEIEIQDEFVKIGLTSILIVEFAQLLRAKYDTNIEQGDLIDFPTIEAVSNYWINKIPKIKELYQNSIDEISLLTEKKVIQNTQNEIKPGDIAIVGIASRFPKSKNKEIFWQNLINKKNVITEIPSNRWDYKKLNSSVSKWGGFVEDMEMFDPYFFKISPKEAELMDPQQRVLLEETWNCLEDAGYKTSKIKNTKTGVFIASFSNDYAELCARENKKPEELSGIALSPSVLANRISYFFDLKGPSCVVDTACSGSLVALEHAILSIRSGKCDQALVGAVNGLFSPNNFITFSKAGMLSSDGLCKTFDESADGYVRSEGCSVIMVKSLEKAKEDNDYIYGVIKGIAVNHGGQAYSLTAPNSNAQAELILDAINEAKVDPETITYIEAHGTGTSLGDPIEVAGLVKAFQNASSMRNIKLKKESCALGSVKTNIGHLESVAGLAGLVKILMAMKNKILPANINFYSLNKAIEEKLGPFFILKENMKWNRVSENIPLRAGVSSFGSGGTNAHVILEEYDNRSNYVDEINCEQVIILSAKKEDRLFEHTTNILNFIKLHKDEADFSLAKIAYTLQVGRDEMDFRLGFVAKSADEVISKLENFINEKNNVYFGNIKKENKGFNSVFKGIEGDNFLKAVIAAKNFDKLVQLWVLGVEVNWELLWNNGSLMKIALPSYPFEKKRFWIETNLEQNPKIDLDKIHPMVHKKITSSSGLSFSSVFTGDEFFLKDHVIAGEPVLPGVGSLEMARFVGYEITKKTVKRITDIVWIKPLIKKNNLEEEININVELEKNGLMSFEIFSIKDKHEEHNVYCQGKLDFIASLDQSSINIEKVRNSSQRKLEKEKIYSEYSNRGIHYGESFRAIEELWIGSDYCLARIKIPILLENTVKDFILHPTIMDASLQSTIGLTLDDVGTFLPFSLKELIIGTETTEIEFVYVKKTLSSNNIKKFDLLLLNKTGEVQISLREFVIRESFLKKNIKEEISVDVQLKKDLIQMVCEVVKVSSADLDSDEDMSVYGFDSILATKFIGMLNDKFNLALTPATFFEYPTINSIVKFILDDHKEVVTEMYGSFLSITTEPMKIIYKTDNANTDIAIIGMSGVFPGSNDLNQYWFNLENKKAFVGNLSENRKLENYNGGYIKDIDKFDSTFFNISPKEAELMDPQHRIFLMTVWRALEDAGISKNKINGTRTAVYAGISTSDYKNLLLNSTHSKEAYIATGSNHSILANRISYFLNLHGPSETIDTACSSSLVAIHRSVNSLLNGECELSIAGGVNALLTKDLFESFNDAGMLSIDGKCKTFDEMANGYVRSEGAGAVVLKTLDKAKADGDRVYAVIKATAVNHGGHVSSLTVPNPNAQAEVIIDALIKSKIDPRTIGLIEAHGTGTKLGDPVEINGLKKAFNHFKINEKGYCVVGSVKPNIGHLEAAAGIAGIIKVVLSLVNKRIPGLVNFKKLNPFIEINNSPFVIESETKDWNKIDINIPRRAGISSFGFGGTNSHIILEEFDNNNKYLEKAYEKFIFIFSAKSIECLNEHVNNMLEFTKSNEFKLSNMSYTLQVGREEFNKRFGFVAGSKSELINKLESYSSEYTGVYRGDAKKSTEIIEDYQNYEKLVEQWVLGANINWNVLWGEVKPIIMSLPNYPFEKLRYWVDDSVISDAVKNNKDENYLSADILKQETTKYLAKLLSQETKVSEMKLLNAEDLSSFGIDSIIVNKYVNKLEKEFSGIPRTLIFEYNNIKSLADFFIENYLPELRNKFSIDSNVEKNMVSTLNVNTKKEFSIDSKIAVIGMSGKYPGSNNLNEFWVNLESGKDLITEIPKDRWDSSKYFDSNKNILGMSYSKWGGFIDDVDKFDPLFWGISPSEAEQMDPQQRLLLEQVWNSIENAGYSVSRLPKNVGVFVGSMWNDYQTIGIENQKTVSANYWQIANRISYNFNFNGPSIVVDTACSSSLTAIHLACESLKRGECSVAIVCGVNISIHQSKYNVLSESGFVSSDGKCRSFGKGGDGYVPGEGVGVIILKPTNIAILDGDFIYANIKGSSVNHGGRTNGFTVPNPNAQSELILQTLEKSQVDPRLVTFVEAHGTGTSLGDPIEIAGLSNAFKKYTKDLQYCSIGSVKSNIGHLEAAAGVAGVMKAILQIQNKKLVPTLHSDIVNPFIDFAKTPFYLQHEPQTIDNDLNSPIIAVVSSFGAGGSNANVILEEYRNVEKFKDDKNSKHIIVISAKKTERLNELVQNILNYIKSNKVNLSSLAYTLQMCREDMSERIGFVAGSVLECEKKLENYLKNNSDVYIGHTKDENLVNEEYIKSLTINKNLEEIVQAWSNGAKINWEIFWENTKPYMVNLPNYPFEKKRYWIQSEGNIKLETSFKNHPLVHVNVSNFKEQKFKSIFTGFEFFLKDHLINGYKVLPGVSYLEMAKAAGEMSYGAPVIKLTDVFWLSPLIVDRKSKNVEIILTLDSEKIAKFEIYSYVNGSDEREIHCQGKMFFEAENRLEQFDLEKLKRFNSVKVIEDKEIYEVYKKRGIEYKNTFQGLVEILVGHDECLAKIKKLILSNETHSGFGLHPALIDSAVQGCIGLMVTNSDGTYLPFALREILLGTEIKEFEYVYIKKITSNNSVQKFDLFLLDITGKTQIYLKEFVVREFKIHKDIEEQKENKIIYIKPEWKEDQLSNNLIDISPVYYLGKLNELYHSLHLEGLIKDKTDNIDEFLQLLKNNPETLLINCFSLSDNFETSLDKAYGSLMKIVKKLIEMRTKNKVNIMVLAPNKPIYGAISGLSKTIEQENTKYRVKLILSDIELSFKELKLELSDLSHQEVQYKNGIREVRKIVEINPTIMPSKLKIGGNYLITGGMGGIGQIFTKYLQRKYQANVYLIGRSDVKTESLDGAVYIKGDVANELDCNRLKNHLPKLDGIIHSAGVIRDNYIIKKDLKESREVFSPKIIGTNNLISTFENEVDFILCFSSTSGLMGNAGQSDYAFANSYLDYLSSSVDKVYSINWPLWKDGGMHVDATVEEYIKKITGMDTLLTDDAIEIFEKTLTLQNKQLMGVTGNRDKIIKYTKLIPKVTKVFGDISEELKNVVEKELIKICGELLKVSEIDLDVNEELSEYGVDSIMMMKILNKVEEFYGNAVEASAIAEHPTIRKFSEFLIREGIADESKKKVEINKIQARFSPTSKPKTNKVAVVSVSCRFPESPTVESFWNNLRLGKELISEVPSERWELNKYFDSNKETDAYKSYSKWGGFIDGIYEFDNSFFGIDLKDALVMDPQHRILLEVAQNLFDRAGYSKDKLNNSKTAVYIGGAESNYIKNNLEKISNESMNHIMVNSIQNMMAARISDFYNLKGESYTIDTACSSSLIAIHQACQAILTGKSQMAVAGGIEILLDERCHVGFAKGQVLSDEPHSYIFDKRAKGFTLGEGVGLVLLKDYEQAIKDNDQILGIVLGSAVNNDGKTVGLTVPSQEGQKEVIREALKIAQVDPATITMYEAHGTGTLLGDPIEVKAATQVYEDFTNAKHYCAIGSVKSNIGHTLHAAGVASFIKTILALQYKEIPATLNCENPHPRFKFEESTFYPITKSEAWNPKCGVRRAAISSFGFGGTNCHLILEESFNLKIVDYPLTKFNCKYFNLAKSDNDLQKEFEEAEKLILNEVVKGNVSQKSADDFILTLKSKYRIKRSSLEKGFSNEERH